MPEAIPSSSYKDLRFIAPLAGVGGWGRGAQFTSFLPLSLNYFICELGLVTLLWLLAVVSTQRQREEKAVKSICALQAVQDSLLCITLIK